LSTDPARLLSPLTGGPAGIGSDAEVAAALVEAEVALVRAWAGIGIAPPAVADEVSAVFGWAGAAGSAGRPDAGSLGASVASHGTPVIELVAWMRSIVGDETGRWIHRGATSQDIIDSALMVTSARAARGASGLLDQVLEALTALAVRERDTPAIARTLTQHAVPTTVGVRVAGWVRGIRRAQQRLDASAAAAPAQLGGAAGTLASFVEIARVEGAASPADAATSLQSAFAGELGLAPSPAWHTMRAPVTELGDAFVQVIDSLAHLAADLSVLGRPEIGEMVTADNGRSSAMPHKRNPTSVVALRAAGLRAPFLGATLHAAAASATDERADGPWQAEWPTLQELAALTYGAAERAVDLARGLNVDRERVAANLALAGDAALSERVAIVRGSSSTGVSARDLSPLHDPAGYLGLAGDIVDDAVEGADGP